MDYLLQSALLAVVCYAAAEAFHADTKPKRILYCLVAGQTLAVSLLTSPPH